MEKTDFEFRSISYLYEIEWKCNQCNSKNYGAFTSEDILVGDSVLMCPKCEFKQYVDLDELKVEINKYKEKNKYK